MTVTGAAVGTTATIAANSARISGMSYVTNVNSTGRLYVTEYIAATTSNAVTLEPGEGYLIRGMGSVSILSELADAKFASMEFVRRPYTIYHQPHYAHHGSY